MCFSYVSSRVLRCVFRYMWYLFKCSTLPDQEPEESGSVVGLTNRESPDTARPVDQSTQSTQHLH